jgi:hypothetical protein
MARMAAIEPAATSHAGRMLLTFSAKDQAPIKAEVVSAVFISGFLSQPEFPT